MWSWIRNIRIISSNGWSLRCKHIPGRRFLWEIRNCFQTNPPQPVCCGGLFILNFFYGYCTTALQTCSGCQSSRTLMAAIPALGMVISPLVSMVSVFSVTQSGFSKVLRAWKSLWDSMVISPSAEKPRPTGFRRMWASSSAFRLAIVMVAQRLYGRRIRKGTVCSPPGRLYPDNRPYRPPPPCAPLPRPGVPYTYGIHGR